MVPRAVHLTLGGCASVVHVLVLRLACPEDQVLPRLQFWLHRFAEQIVGVLPLELSFHLGLCLESWSVVVERAVSHHGLPLAAEELVVAGDFESQCSILCEGRLHLGVAAAVEPSLLLVGLAGILNLLLGALLDELGQLLVEDDVLSFLLQFILELLLV